MPQFVMYCLDGAKVADLRPQVRESHLAYLRGSGLVRIAGPMLDAEGKPVGSLLIVEAEDIEAVRAFSAADPYNLAGVFASVEIRPFALSIADLPSS